MIAPGARVADRFNLLRLESGASLYRAYTALELGVAREVTLWIPHAGLLTTPEARARFVDAARATRNADGAHLVRVLDAGVDPFLGAQEAAAVAGVGAARGGVWVSVAPSTGQTLAERIARGRPAPNPVVAYLAQSLARAIDSAHAGGFVHGYLRAADVVMAGEWPRLSGVGLWAHVDRVAALAALRADVHLLAPEVRGGEAPGPRADVYAMAVILAEVALGQAAESGAEAAVLRDRLRRERPKLEAALRTAFSAAPAERPASATLLANELAGLAPPARTGRATGQEVRIGGQVVTPVVGSPHPIPYAPLEVPTLPTSVPAPQVRRSPTPASSIAAAILSASELDDAERAFDDMTGEFETRPRDLLTPPPPAAPKPMPAQDSMRLRGTGATPVPPPHMLSGAPASFPRSSGEMSSAQAQAQRRASAQLPVPTPPPRRGPAEMSTPTPPPDARVVARGTQPPPSDASPLGQAPPPHHPSHAPPAPHLPQAYPSSMPTPAPVVLSPQDQPLMLINVRPESAIPQTYESLSIEDDPPTSQVHIEPPRAASPRPGSLDEEAAIATAEFDADAATAARAIATAALSDAAPRTSIDPEQTPAGGVPAATALPLPAPEITEIRKAPILPPPSLELPPDDDGPLIIASTLPAPRRYPTAQIAVGDSFAERALDANRKKLKLLGLAVVLVAGAAGLVFWWQHSTAVPPPPPPQPIAAAVPPPRPARPAPVAAPAAAPVHKGPCPAGMILVEGKERFCIDVDEAAGPDHLPRVGVAQAAAASACAAQGKRLCHGREWELACRGANHASYPWGSKPSSSNLYCNLGPGRTIQPVGSFEHCISASGARDMSGNAAEWVAEGQLRGGSALVTGDGRCSRPLKLTANRPLDDAGFRCCADALTRD